MKKIVLFTFMILVIFSAESQKKKKVSWEEWQDSEAFFNGPEPIILGFGEKSDSLSKIYNGRTFFEIEGTYYCIDDAADYYYWYTKKYPHVFKKGYESYEYFYLRGNDYEMASYISTNFIGKKRPLKFALIYDNKGTSFNVVEERRYNKYDKMNSELYRNVEVVNSKPIPNTPIAPPPTIISVTKTTRISSDH